MTLPSRPLNWRPAASLGLPLAAGAVGGIVTAGAIPTWYAALDKPAWNPPNAVFGPVWTVLYLAMGVALAFVWQRSLDARRRRAVIIFGVQLVLNLAWTLTFFGLRQTGLAVVVIAALWITIAATIILFGSINWRAAALLVPYLAWVTFASALNVAVWQLNT